MNIGTPLTSNATRVALCGSGELGKEVVIELQRYGCEVIAIDRYENAPAMQVAHRSYSIDMLNADELRAVLEKEKPHTYEFRVSKVRFMSDARIFTWHKDAGFIRID